jgi:hypothetical protein
LKRQIFCVFQIAIFKNAVFKNAVSKRFMFWDLV